MFCETPKCSLNTLSLKSTLACFWIEPSGQTEVFYFWFGVSAEQVPWSQITHCTPGRLWTGLWTKTYNYHRKQNNTQVKVSFARFTLLILPLFIFCFFCFFRKHNITVKTNQTKLGPEWWVKVGSQCLPISQPSLSKSTALLQSSAEAVCPWTSAHRQPKTANMSGTSPAVMLRGLILSTIYCYTKASAWSHYTCLDIVNVTSQQEGCWFGYHSSLFCATWMLPPALAFLPKTCSD